MAPRTIIGAALAGIPRRDFVLSTKKSVGGQGQLISAAELARGWMPAWPGFRRIMSTSTICHGVRADQYDYAVAELMPAMLRLREAGKDPLFGHHRGVCGDTGHQMMARAVREDAWDVVMVGFTMLNQSARARVLAETQRRGIGCCACSWCAMHSAAPTSCAKRSPSWCARA